MLRIRSWNVNGLGGPEVWGDIAARDGEWRTAGWTDRPPWDRRTAIVAPTPGLSGGIELRAHPLVGIGDEHDDDALAVSRHGTLAAADVLLDDGPLTLVSMYAG